MTIQEKTNFWRKVKRNKDDGRLQKSYDKLQKLKSY